MRVVSLVPSLTEAVAVSVPGVLVGATDWCSHPADLDVVRVKGTKNPDVERIVGLAPDLVIANEEENREPDLAALRQAGLDVLVTEVRDVPGAFRELERVVRACGLRTRPRWLDEAQEAWLDPPRPERRLRAAVPIWRRPWMVLGPGHLRRGRAGAARRRQRVRDAHRTLSACPGRRTARRRSRPGRAARRAVPLHERRRPRGVPRCALRTGRRAPSHVVRTVVGGSSTGARRGAASSRPLTRPRTVWTAATAQAARSRAYRATVSPS